MNASIVRRATERAFGITFRSPLVRPPAGPLRGRLTRPDPDGLRLGVRRTRGVGDRDLQCGACREQRSPAAGQRRAHFVRFASVLHAPQSAPEGAHLPGATRSSGGDGPRAGSLGFSMKLLASLLASVLAGCSLVAPRSAEQVVWKADAECSMSSEWASSSSVPDASSPPNPDPSRISQSTYGAQGSRSYRFELRDGDYSSGERVELGQALPAISSYQNRLFRAGEERWISMQYYFPADWATDNTWQTVFQIKPVSSGGGGPNIGIDAGGNRLTFYGNNNTWGSTAGAFQDGTGPLSMGSYPLTKRRWIKLTWHIVFSANPSAGSLEVFGDLGDGQGMRTLVPRRTRATMKYLNGKMDPAHLRVGIYRNPTMTATQSLYVDGITVATTRTAAETNAYGRP
jgi:hypothetical protein